MSGNPSPIIEVGGPHQPPTSAKDNLFRRVRQLKKLVMHRTKSGQTNKSTKNQTEEEELFEQSTRGEGERRRRRRQECGGQVDENFGDSYEEISEVFDVGGAELNQLTTTLEEQLPEQLDRVLALSESSELSNLKTPIFTANHQRSKQKNNFKTEALSPFTADLLSLRRKRQQIRNNFQKSGLAQPTIAQSTAAEPALSSKAHETSTISRDSPNQSYYHHNRNHHRKRVYKKVQAESSGTEKVDEFLKDWNQKLDPMPMAYHQHKYNPYCGPANYYGPYGPTTYPYSNCYYHHHPFVGPSHPMESYGYQHSAGAGVGALPTQSYGPCMQAPPYGPWLQYQPYPPISVHPFYSNCLNPGGNPLVRSSPHWYPSNIRQPTNPAVSPESVSSNFATPVSGPVQDFAINSRYLSKKEDKLVSKFVGTATATPPATSSGDKSKQQHQRNEQPTIVGSELLMENSQLQQPTAEVKSQNSSIYPRFDVSTRRDSILAQILEGDQFVIDEQSTGTNQQLHWSIEN